MFENLIQLVQQHAGDAIVKNPAIPNEHNNAAIETTAQSIMETMKNQSGAGFSQLAGLFQGGNNASANPMVNTITQNVIGSLMQKFGISQLQASGIAQNLIPQVMNSLVKKTNDPADNSFTMEGILQSLGLGGGAGNILSNLFK